MTEMSRVFFDELAIPQPDFHLGVGSASHTVQTARMLARLEEPLVATQPHAVLWGTMRSAVNRLGGGRIPPLPHPTSRMHTSPSFCCVTPARRRDFRIARSSCWQ